MKKCKIIIKQTNFRALKPLQAFLNKFPNWNLAMHSLKFWNAIYLSTEYPGNTVLNSCFFFDVDMNWTRLDIIKSFWDNFIKCLYAVFLRAVISVSCWILIRKTNIKLASCRNKGLNRGPESVSVQLSNWLLILRKEWEEFTDWP